MKRIWAFFLDILYLPVLFLVLPFLYLKQEKYRRSLPPRFVTPPPRHTDKPCLWIHGVSVGEVKATKTFLEAFQQQHPEWEVVLSTTTNTGFEEAQRLFPQLLVFRFPLDLSFLLERAFSRLKPQLIVLMELELWPNFLLMAAIHQVPVGVLNGRLSEKSFRNYRRFRWFSSWMLHLVQFYLVQNQEYADRFAFLGITRKNIEVTGNMKMDQKIPSASPDLRERLQFSLNDLILVCGSTHPGENEILIEHYQTLKSEFPSLKLILVPRHPEKVNEVAEHLRKKEISFFRWKKEQLEETWLKTSEPVLLVDQMGVLTQIYQIADLVFVGKTLMAHGGQNMVEPVLLGKRVVVGPYTENFKEEMRFLKEHKLVEEVQTPEELFTTFQQLLKDPLRNQKGVRASEVWKTQMGASQRNLQFIETQGYLKKAGHSCPQQKDTSVLESL
ncbi:MAG: 3-deoxy-D-manno-octulosonic acid transferase [Planctomycetota bacterium]